MHVLEDGISMMAATLLFMIAATILINAFSSGMRFSERARQETNGGNITAVNKDAEEVNRAETNAYKFETYNYEEAVKQVVANSTATQAGIAVNGQNGVVWINGKKYYRHVTEKDANGKQSIYYTREP